MKTMNFFPAAYRLLFFATFASLAFTGCDKKENDVQPSADQSNKVVVTGTVRNHLTDQPVAGATVNFYEKKTNFSLHGSVWYPEYTATGYPSSSMGTTIASTTSAGNGSFSIELKKSPTESASSFLSDVFSGVSLQGYLNSYQLYKIQSDNNNLWLSPKSEITVHVKNESHTYQSLWVGITGDSYVSTWVGFYQVDFVWDGQTRDLVLSGTNVDTTITLPLTGGILDNISPDRLSWRASNSVTDYYDRDSGSLSVYEGSGISTTITY